MTRQRKWQIKQAEKGLCQLCGCPAVVNVWCLKHAIDNRERQRLSHGCVRRYNSLSYRLEKQG